MKQLYTFLFLFAMLSALGLRAQTLTLKGTVKDQKTGEALIGATVSQKGTKLGASTDYEGSFLLKLPGAKLPVTITISYIGYLPQDLVVNSTDKPLQIRLKENTRELGEVKITDSRITEKQKQAPLTVETMDAIAIKETPAANFYEGLAHLKGVDMTSASIGFKIINTRGFNSTSPVRSLQLIDGVDNQSPGLNFSLGNFLGASELDVQKVDLIVGASGAYYGPNAFNGVINMQSKSPFQFPGLSVQMRFGERKLVETAIRYAEVFKNKNGEEKVAYKLNLFTMSARDWEANNTDVTIQSPVDPRNPGGYDAVNRYGDEYSTSRFRQTGLSYLGYGYALRKGYNETDLVDYNSRNLKINAAVHVKVKKNKELIFSSNLGNGTTVYQGDNRFSLKDIFFFQNRIEFRQENKFFVRVYATNEDAGKSYDAYSTALLLQNYAKTDNNWAIDYAENWNRFIFNRIQSIRPVIGSQPPGVRYEDYANTYLYEKFYDSLSYYHWLNGMITDTSYSGQRGGIARFIPGTNRFDSAFNSIIGLTNREGGSRFFDRSALYHAMGEYQFLLGTVQVRTGASFRLYAPNSRGTIFLDTIADQRISNKEGGAYMGLENKFFDDQLKVSVTARADKNQNFNLLFSPAATAVYTHKSHVIRVSASAAIRNPTLTDQYINLNVGRATLLGNLKGFDSLVTVGSMIDAFNFGRDKLKYFNVEAIKPERVRTLEFGYRGNISDKIFVDLSYYFSWYFDFIGYKIGADVDWPASSPLVNSVKVYRVSANAKDMVTTQGFSIGLNYFWQKYLGFAGNFSWNKLDRRGSTDELIPAFNTPEYKYNIGINGRDIDFRLGKSELNGLGYSINWKWQEGFNFEGSPQFTGFVPSYGMLDAQVNKTFIEDKLTVKLGASNLLDNRVIQVYGGPRVGRLAYVSILFDFAR
ncbi:MAG: TonB-dependent receptor [Bacteroidetes bacterium]|nr:TonB-dependent receptor [Bacteroidota bacterium]